MSAISLTIQALLAAPDVTAVVSNRIQPHPVRQGTALPAIAVTMSAENMEYLLGGASQYPQSSVQIHCLGTAASEAVELGEAVKLALQDLHYTSADTPPVHASFSKDAVDFMDFSDDLTTYRRVMSFDIRWRTGSGIEAELPGVVADQEIEFGGKTLPGDGGAMALDEDGAEIEFVSVDSDVSGDGTGWSISGGMLVRSSTPATSDGAVLRCTTSNGQIDVTLKASGLDADGNDLAVSYSVSDIAELLASCHATDLAFGDNILLRTGAGLYNETQTQSIGRSAANGPIAGTWVPPSLYNSAHPDQGCDLDTGNFVKITKHAGANPVVAKIRIRGNAGGGAAQYFRVHRLRIVFTPLALLTNPGAEYGLAGLVCDLGGHTVAFDRNDVSSQPDPELFSMLQTYSGIYVGNGPAWIQDNDIHDVGAAISVGGGTATSRANDTWVVGNNIYRFTVDGMGVNPADNLTIAYNHWFDVRIQDPASLGAGLHPDCCQFANASMTSTNVRFIGNRFQQGDYVMNPPDDHGAQGPFGGPNPALITAASITGTVLTVTTKGGGLPIADGQSLYGTNVLPGTTIVFPQLSGAAGGAGTYTVSQSHSATGTQAMMALHEVRNSVAAGNMVVMAEQANQINFGGWVDSVIYNNTAVMDAVGVAGNGTIYPVNPSGLDIRYNIANMVGPDVFQAGTVSRTPTTGYAENNIVLQAAYADNFVAPASGAGITDLAAQFDTKPGVYVTGTDDRIPGACSAYINFGSRAVGEAWDGTGRTHAFPWEGGRRG